MRRIILSLLLVLTSVFVISCSDSDSYSGSSSTFTPISKDNPDTWVGTYDLYHLGGSYLYLDTGIVISNNCQRDAKYYDFSHCNNVEAIGELVVSKDETGKYRFETKIQLSQKAPLDTGDYLEHTYTYVDYGAIAQAYSQSQIYNDDGTVIIDEKGNPVMETYLNLGSANVTGRTLTKEFASNLTPPLLGSYFIYIDRESLKINYPYPRNLGYDYIIFHKKSDTPKTLEPNTPYTPMNGFKEVPDKADEVVQ